MHESGDDAELLTRARAGHAESFGALCERHRLRVWRVVTSVSRGAEAEDLAQEALVRAYGSLRHYRGEAPFGAWLCRIALNVAHDYQRSAWRRRVLLFDLLPDRAQESGDCPAGELERRELQRRVRQEVAALPPRQRVPIWLHYFEGFPLAEVARLEGVPESTARSRLRAGLRRLSLSLEDVLGSGLEGSAPLLPEGKGCGA